MVKIISSASLGYGDYGANFSDAEVDGVAFSKEGQQVDKKTKEQPEPVKASKLTGGRKLQ